MRKRDILLPKIKCEKETFCYLKLSANKRKLSAIKHFLRPQLPRKLQMPVPLFVPGNQFWCEIIKMKTRKFILQDLVQKNEHLVRNRDLC